VLTTPVLFAASTALGKAGGSAATKRMSARNAAVNVISRGVGLVEVTCLPELNTVPFYTEFSQ
jgi:hypothetical protein